MRSKSFGPTIGTLQRAYFKLLHETFENEWSSAMSASVKNLAAAIAHKLHQQSEEDSKTGSRHVHKMLEHMLAEFTWKK